MTQHDDAINRRVKEMELTNPLAEILYNRHGEQIAEVEEYLGGIGYFDEPGGNTCDPQNHYRCRPATDEECRLAKMIWDLELSIDITGDIPAQVSEQLAKLARRMMRAAKRIELTASAGEFSADGREKVFRTIKDGVITGTFPTKSAAVLHAMRTDGRWFEDDDDEDE